MNFLRSRLALFICMALAGTSVFAQTVFFRAEQITVGQSAATGGKCIQVALSMETSGVGTDEAWEQFTINLDYTDADGILDGQPVVRMSNFVGANNGPEVAISDPAQTVTGSSCATGDVVNSATLGGPAQNFTADLNPAAPGAQHFATTNITASHITLAQLDLAPFFATTDGEESVLAIVEFPLVASPALGSAIELNFNGDNILNRTGREVLPATTVDGYVLVFSPLDCSGATVADNNGSASGSSIEINYLDAQAGGTGGDITFTLPHATTDPASIQIVGSDGFDQTYTGGDIGSGSSTINISTSADASPATSADSVTYTITYIVDNPLGGTSAGGTCEVTVTWAQPSCTIASDPVSPQLGDNTDFDVTLTNAAWDGTRFGVLTHPNGTVDLVTPTSTAGNVLTFDAALNIATIALGDAGSYSVAGSGPGVGNNSACNDDVFFVCPTNSTVCPSTAVAIGGSVTITLDGTAVADWDVTYNGSTTNYPGTTTEVTIDNLVGTATQVTITANGADVSGPCSDDVTCDLEFVDPTCVSTTQDPDSTTMPVDVGTVITLTLVTDGAISATIDGVPMTATTANTWTATHTAVADETITAVITDPNGDTNTCDWVIDINCVEPTLVLPLPDIGSTGITITGTPDCTYTVFIVGPDGTETTIDITVGPDGTGTDNSTVIEPDTTYSVGQQGQPNPGGVITTVPTLGEWGLIAFVTMLMASGVVFMRRRRLA